MVIDFKAIREKPRQPAEGAQFTPGPWYAANMGNDFQGLVVEEQTGKNIAVAYDKRDVHILAAAPAMYEALSKVAKLRQQWRDDVIGSMDYMDELDTLDFGALAQAEGRQG